MIDDPPIGWQILLFVPLHEGTAQNLDWFTSRRGLWQEFLDRHTGLW
jgi:hypothetical protein